jgi:hypothetical protein
MGSTMIAIMLPALFIGVSVAMGQMVLELKEQNKKLSMIIEYLHDIKK